MQTLSFIRLPVYGSGGDVSGVCAGVRGTRVTVASDCRGDRADENSSYRIGMRRDGKQANADPNRTERQPPRYVRNDDVETKREGVGVASLRSSHRRDEGQRRMVGRREDFRENARNERTSKFETNAR